MTLGEQDLDILCYACRKSVLVYHRGGYIRVRCPTCLQRASLSSAIVECQIYATDVEVLTEAELRRYPYRFMPAGEPPADAEDLFSYGRALS